MREAAEKVQENMRKLAAGGEQQAGLTRAFTPEERDALLKDTFEKINELKAKTKAYIDHAEPKGKAPRTGAGKDRLAGAKAVRDITKDLEKAISKEPKIRELKQEAMKKQAQKKQAEKQQTAKKAEAEKARTK